MRQPLLPMSSAPRDGKYVLLFGDSGYMTTPFKCAVCKYDAEFRPHRPWIDHADNAFEGEPVGWLPLPKDIILVSANDFLTYSY